MNSRLWKLIYTSVRKKTIQDGKENYTWLKEEYTLMERNLYRCLKKIIPIWKENYTYVERNLYRCVKKITPMWKVIYTDVERNSYRHPSSNLIN